MGNDENKKKMEIYNINDSIQRSHDNNLNDI